MFANAVSVSSIHILTIEHRPTQTYYCRQAVMKEAMRLHPGVQMPLERIVPQGGTTVSGMYLPGGTVVGINPIVIHHDTDVYGADASEFRPERWLESSAEQLKLMDRSFLAVRSLNL